MTHQDIITNEQQLVKVLSELSVENVLDDNNHRFLLHFLVKQPLTVDEIKIEFKKSGNDKSDKTIYRYLKKLKRAGLVIEAGKRIFTDNKNQIKTQTLFARVAKIIFTPQGKTDSNPKLKQTSLKITSMLLKDRLNLRSDADLDCIQKQVDNITKVKNELISDHFQSSKNSELMGLIQTMDIYELYPILDTVSWILLLNENPDAVKEIIKCFK
ncbi:MAG: winged helix-turn-helix domain-containing protein [Candidatus Heimdallarchaeota archaeon]